MYLYSTYKTQGLNNCSSIGDFSFMMCNYPFGLSGGVFVFNLVFVYL